MADDYPGDTAPHPEDIPNLSLSKINQLLYLLGSINGANYPADVAPHPNDTANLSLHKINRILKEGTFGPDGSAVWGAITGDIEDQADLDAALAAKQTAAQVQALIDAIHGGSYTETTTAAGTITLTAASTYAQFFIGSANQNLKLPSQALLVNGFQFLVVNRSSGNVTVRTFQNDTVAVLAFGDWAIFTKVAGDEAETDWNTSPSSIGFAKLVSPAFTGTPTAPTQSASDNSTKIATTAYADQGVAQALSTAIASGTFGSVANNGVNLDSVTASTVQWLRVGNIVTVAGRVVIEPTLPATLTSFRMDLPVTINNFTDDFQAGGTAASESVAGQVAAIRARAGDVQVEFVWVSVGTASQNMFFSFTYQIIP